MKFKMQDKQNQQIQRITDQYLVVGVDIALQIHVARAVNYRGIVRPILNLYSMINFKQLQTQ